MTTTDRAAAIRSALKSEGITARQVSVRAFDGGTHASITLTVKPAGLVAGVSVLLCEYLAAPFADVRFDAAGVPVGGGNTYVVVRKEVA